MGAYEEVKRMQQIGQSQQDIIASLQQRGYSSAQIENALSQAQIKMAVNSPPVEPMQIPQQEQYREDIPSPMSPPMSMQQSMDPRENEQEIIPQSYPPQEALQPYPQESYPPQDFNQYPYSQQEPQQSTDIIAEIADQIISEKLASIKTQLEKTLDLKTITETKISHLDERMQRIEKIIDRLQLSILQKVGEYTTNVSDIKKELLETQKSFKTINSTPQTHVHQSHQEHQPHQSNEHHSPQQTKHPATQHKPHEHPKHKIKN
jgi:hypothetical protein